MEYAVIILAAGSSSRMNSNLPKPLHRLGGKPLLAWVLDASILAGASRQVVVVPEGNTAINDFIAEYGGGQGVAIATAIQAEPLGTGAAVECAKEVLKNSEGGDFDGIAVITYADTPLLMPYTIKDLAKKLHESDAAIACLGFHTESPSGYGRIILGDDGTPQAIIEDSDATTEEQAITLVNSGVMALKLPQCFDLLEKVVVGKGGERYLTSLIGLAKTHGHKTALMEGNASEAMGINSRADLAQAEAEMQRRLRLAAMKSGATLIAPDTVFLHHDTILEADAIIEPHVVFGAGVTIGAGSHIKSFSHLEGVKTGSCCVIGPYARLRENTILGEGVKIGNFVETKNTHIDDGVKANHLSYLGDSIIGEAANIGAGAIFCNYDGFTKHQTYIGAGAFIGSNTALVAPVAVGDGAIIGAGSTITHDVGPDALAIARSDQQNLDSAAKRLRQSRQKP